MMRIEHAVLAMGQIVLGVVGFTAIAVSVVFTSLRFGHDFRPSRERTGLGPARVESKLCT
jgi:hypothetical protein